MVGSPVGTGERITRFARHSSQYSAVANRVRHTAFMPPMSLRLSVFRTSDMGEVEIWDLADSVVSSKKSIQARADLTANDVRVAGLEVETAPDPHPKHADIVGWPEEKPEQMSVAKEMATQAALVLR
jgi:hypothetical protein